MRLAQALQNVSRIVVQLLDILRKKLLEILDARQQSRTGGGKNVSQTVDSARNLLEGFLALRQ